LHYVIFIYIYSSLRGIFQHNDPKHTAKITQELLKKKKVKTITYMVTELVLLGDLFLTHSDHKGS
uniref:Uncharacterized protein n=1 Tax=Electrophorus electricus TaxID=8005 RepID=A0AAY5F3R9_ELEEL